MKRKDQEAIADLYIESINNYYRTWRDSGGRIDNSSREKDKNKVSLAIQNIALGEKMPFVVVEGDIGEDDGTLHIKHEIYPANKAWNIGICKQIAALGPTSVFFLDSDNREDKNFKDKFWNAVNNSLKEINAPYNNTKQSIKSSPDSDYGGF